ncbi:cupin domain-containing protein [Egibacter rhizosphaerae]|uniref:cupin domain-containing protein n=1 Tax=Egibacter rhizosphaerae TaxID=1670831 RepID=UPI0013F179BD|nr:cupin domain-containing protein [Egibacter rhizosphaerae]
MRDPAATLLGDPDLFARQTFGREIARRDVPDAAGLLGLDDVDHLLADTALRAPAFRLVREGRALPPEQYTRRARIGSRTVTDLADVEAVHRLIGEGATLVLQGLHRYWPPVTRACQALEHALDHPVQANAYLTPPVAAGLHVHGDPHDVLVVQTWGRKRWQVWPPGTDPNDPGDPALDDDLRLGDVLYLPAGTPHAPRTIDAASLHLTVGIRSRTWRELVRRAVDDALTDPRYDEPLAAGWTSRLDEVAAGLSRELQHVGRSIAEQDAAQLATAHAVEAIGRRPARHQGTLPLLLDPTALTDGTRLEKVGGHPCEVVEAGARVELVLADRRLRVPGRAAGAVHAVAALERLTPGDLSDHLDEHSRLVFARRLVREGLLRPVPPERDDAPSSLVGGRP